MDYCKYGNIAPILLVTALLRLISNNIEYYAFFATKYFLCIKCIVLIVNILTTHYKVYLCDHECQWKELTQILL